MAKMRRNRKEGELKSVWSNRSGVEAPFFCKKLIGVQVRATSTQVDTPLFVSCV